MNELPPPSPSAGLQKSPPAAPQWKPPKFGWGARVAMALCAVFAVSALINLLAADDAMTDDEARDAATEDLVNAGASPAQAECFVDSVEERFGHLGGDIGSDDPEDNTYMMTALFECMGIPSETSACFVEQTSARFGIMAPNEFVEQVGTFDAEDRQFLFEIGLRCAGFDDDQIACTRTAVLAEYPAFFEQKVVPAEQQSYRAERAAECAN